MQLIALKTRSAAATSSASMIFFPLLFLTPNFVPRDLLTRPMEIAASCQPGHLPDGGAALADPRGPRWGTILPGFGVVAAAGALMLFLNVRMMERYD